MVRKGVRGFDPGRLRSVREERRARTGHATGRWTQEHVAELLGVERSNYVAWEQGGRTPSPATLVRLAALLEVAPHELTDVDPDQASLADLRQWAGLTQLEVAEELDVSRSLYAAIERGERRLDERHLAALAEAFSVPPHRVLAAAE